MQLSCEAISPTAKMVAYLRTFTDIKYSTELAKACSAEDAFHEIASDQSEQFMVMTPLIEQRFKAVSERVDHHFHVNTLELAAGISPRGLLTEDRLSTYLETDLPDILEEKKRIVRKIFPNTGNNLHFFINVDSSNKFGQK